MATGSSKSNWSEIDHGKICLYRWVHGLLEYRPVHCHQRHVCQVCLYVQIERLECGYGRSDRENCDCPSGDGCGQIDHDGQICRGGACHWILHDGYGQIDRDDCYGQIDRHGEIGGDQTGRIDRDHCHSGGCCDCDVGDERHEV